MRADPLDLRRALERIAAPQGGFFSAAQARAAGYSHQAQRYHLQRGAWERVDRGLYRIAGWPVPEHPDFIRWSLWSRGGGVVSHDSALVAHDLGDAMPARVHLTVPPGFRSRSDAVVLHRARLAPKDEAEQQGFRVTTPIRTLLDVAEAGADPDHLAHAVDDALRRGLLTERQLRAASDDAPPQVRAALSDALGFLGGGR